MRGNRWLAWVCLISLVLASCGGNGGPPPLPIAEGNPPVSLKLSAPLDSSRGVLSGISAYPDINGDGRDAFCRQGKTYAGHPGTDFDSTLAGMLGGIDVLSTHKGVVLVSTDGKYDLCTQRPEDPEDCKPPVSAPRPGLNEGNTYCSDLGNYCDGKACYYCSDAGNYIVIQYDASRATFYGHLAKGSVAVKAGDAVAQGQVIGRLGSSGFSSGPHLHFGVLDLKNLQPIDPWFGSCNSTLTETLWDDQALMLRRHDLY